MVVHAGGEALQRTIAEGPFLVKPDVRTELELQGMPVRSAEEIIHAGKKVIEQGSRRASSPTASRAISSSPGTGCGVRGPGPAYHVQNLVGADDALVGGLLAALLRGEPLVEAARYGMAAAVASAGVEEKLCLDPGAIRRELDHVGVRRRGGMKAHEVMRRDLTSVDLDTTVSHVMYLLYQSGLSSLPVVDEDGRVVGVISERDLIRAVLRGTWTCSNRRRSCRASIS